MSQKSTNTAHYYLSTPMVSFLDKIKEQNNSMRNQYLSFSCVQDTYCNTKAIFPYDKRLKMYCKQMDL